MRPTPQPLLITILLTALAAWLPAAPLRTAFTYQGHLADAHGSVNDSADLRFTLWDELGSGAPPAGGSRVGTVVALSDITVVDGLFTVTLDFGVDAFDGQALWLQIAVRSPHDATDRNAFTTLSPRQPLTVAPYALQTRGIFVDEELEVGIGTVEPNYPLHVESDSTSSSAAVYGRHTAPSGTTHGGRFESDSTAGSGVFGEATAGGGLTAGVFGRSNSTSGLGVLGWATAGSGTTRGVAGQVDSASGSGVYGQAGSATGTTYGVYGQSNSTSGRGVFGEANAVAAIEKHGAPLIIVDFGTATPLDIVSREREYIGGVILAGLQTTAEALFQRAAKLPLVHIEPPKSAVGRSTVDAMQAGLFHGCVDAIEGSVRRIEEELGYPFRIVATGGLAAVLGPAMRRLDAVEPHLTLHGIELLWRRATTQAA